MAKKGAKLLHVEQNINPFSLAEEFILMRKSTGISSFTVSSNRIALRTFFAEYKGSIKDTKKLAMAINIFLADKKSGYHNKLLQSLRQFFDYCIGENIITVNPCENIKFKRETARIVQHDEKTIKALLSLPDQSTFAGLRDYVIILTMLDTGIRPNELLQIKFDDIDFMNQQLIVREEYSKTRAMRMLPLSERVLHELKKLIQVRHEDWERDTPVFCAFSGHRLSSHNFQERFKQYSEKLGVRITPYHLRHTFALWFIRNGGGVFALQKIMGHAKLDMTRNYVELVQADLKDSHDKASPLNNLFTQDQRVRKLPKKPFKKN